MSSEIEVSERELKRLSRRGFVAMAAAAAAGFGSWKWLRTRERIGDLPWPFRRMLETNESLARAYFSPARLSPLFRKSDITRERINGHLGLQGEVDANTWRLHIAGAAAPIALTLNDVMALPRHEMITEFRCIEGWSTVVQWTGARLADLVAKYPPVAAAEYIGMETPDGGYYVGLDMASALHPQTLLAYAMNGRPLTGEHGAPLRLAIPVKYGVKNIKRIGTIRYATERPPDFWGERGYDWYAGH
jgi:DMSO/TMAO reductase YedYZ molybdopterin-dependent catalytic subunit